MSQPGEFATQPDLRLPDRTDLIEIPPIGTG
jgi:hypothetical protein